jgi:hypothetical protein
MRYGNGYLKITVKDVFGYSVVLDATEIEELYALKGPLVFPGENLLTVKTNGLSYSPLRATSYGDSLLLLRDEGDFIRFEYPSI